VHIHDPSQLTIDDQLYYLIPPKKHDWNTLGYTTYSTNHTHQLIMDASPGDQPTWMILALGRWGFIWMNLLSTTGSLGTTHKMEVPIEAMYQCIKSTISHAQLTLHPVNPSACLGVPASEPLPPEFSQFLGSLSINHL